MKRTQSIQHQVVLLLAAILILLEVLNIFTQYRINYSYVFRDVFHDGDMLARNAAMELESYTLIDWLTDYWEEHENDMSMPYDDKSFGETEEELRRQLPVATELTELDEEGLSRLDERGQRLYAELCYVKLCRKLDRLKALYEPQYIYAFRVRGDEMYVLLTGISGEEKRISQGGRVFELGSTSPYTYGRNPVLDEIISTGESVDDMEIYMDTEAKEDRAHVYEPVKKNGEIVCLIGVTMYTSEMRANLSRRMNDALIRSALILLFMVACVTVMLYYKVIKPLRSEQEIIGRYERTKDGKAAVADLKTIRSRNEVQRIAESFSGMVEELDRYMAEIVNVTEEKERISAELDVAAKIQTDMLPRTFPAYPEREEFDLCASMTAAKYVGGDFYDFFMIDDDRLALVIADVSGKGVPAALFMVTARSLIKNRALIGTEPPARILSYVNDQICEGNEEQLFVTVWFGILRISTGEIVCANAGHEYPAVGRAGSGFELIRSKHGPPLGIFAGASYRNEEIRLGEGDWLFVYTDGVPEAQGADHVMFGEERMMAVLDEGMNGDAAALLQKMKKATGDFVGDADAFDDLTMLTVRIRRLKKLSEGAAGTGAGREVMEGQETEVTRELTLEADMTNLNRVLSFVDSRLEAAECDPSIQMVIDLAVEELFTNVASYAYAPGTGPVTIRVKTGGTGGIAEIVFTDRGVPYDPLKQTGPNLDGDIESRRIGGLGIYMVKNSMDDMSYEYRDGNNVLTIRKKIRTGV